MESKSSRNIAAELTELDAKVNALLPPRYQHCYGTVSPNSMGSATLKYGADGKIAWDQIWTTYCDLALAGGPPHRGTLLEPPSQAEILADPERQAAVVAELDRAIGLTSGAVAIEGNAPGWIEVRCASETEAAWLQFAIIAENVSARRRGSFLQLPAGPAFRAEKEIKNVVVALAKSLHYWDGHLSESQQELASMADWSPATQDEVNANSIDYDAARHGVEAGLLALGLSMSSKQYAGWVGIETADDEEAVWLLRAVVVERVPARRENNVLFLPIDPSPKATRSLEVARAFSHAWDLRKASTQRRPAWRPSGRVD